MISFPPVWDGVDRRGQLSCSRPDHPQIAVLAQAVLGVGIEERVPPVGLSSRST